MGGIAAIFIVQGINIGSQLAGIGITILISLIPGYIVGRIMLALGSIKRHYDDSVEIINVDEA